MTNKDIRKQAAFTLSLFARQAKLALYSDAWAASGTAISDIYDTMDEAGDETYKKFEAQIEKLEYKNPGLDWANDWAVIL